MQYTIVGRLAESEGAPLAVWDREKTYAYACGALLYGKVQTLFPPYERRTWLLFAAQESRQGSLLYSGENTDVCRPFTFHKIRCDLADEHQHEALIRFPGKSAIDALKLSGVIVRHF